VKPRRKQKTKPPQKRRKTDSFGWDDAWAIGRFDLGLSEEEFWALTPRKFRALLKRLNRRERENEWLNARIIATIYNVNLDPKKRTKPYQAEDFMRTEKKKPDASKFKNKLMEQTQSQKETKKRRGVE
jgi:hypothetical protein